MSERFAFRRWANRPDVMRIVGNVGWLSFDRVLRMGVGLLVGAWVARHLGPEQFGQLSFAIVFTGLLGAIAALGLPGIVVRDVARDPNGAPATLGTAALLHLIGALVIYPVTVGLAWIVRPHDGSARLLVAILGSAMLLKVSDVAIYWFESQVRSKYIILTQNAGFLLFALVKVALILHEASVVAFAWVTLLEALLVAVVMGWVLHRYGMPVGALTATRARAGTLLRDSWPLMVSAIAVTLYMKIDQIMLGVMIGDEAVGVYAAATRISEVWYFIPLAISASVFPALLDAKRTSEASYYARLQWLFDLMVVISLVVAVPIAFFAPQIVSILFGVGYRGAESILVIHVWTSVFVFLGVVGSQWFVAENRQILTMERSAVGALANVGLNLLLIPPYGANGAAAATLLSQAIASWLYDGVRQASRPIFRMKCAAMNPARWFRSRAPQGPPAALVLGLLGSAILHGR